MRYNATIKFFDATTYEEYEEPFCDPYIYRFGGELWRWTDKEWRPGMTYGGKPIGENLIAISFDPRHNPHRPPTEEYT